MGRPPSNGAPSFRFHPSEVAQMDAILQKHEGHVPPRDLLVALADRFSNSPERAGKIVVQMKQVWNWFQNRRYSLRAKLVKPPEKPNTSFVTRDEISPMRNVPFAQPMVVSSAPHAVRYASEASPMEFEARSARDGAWYDVQEFLSHRYLETGNPEVLVRFSGFGQNEDEWVNVRNHARQRSLPCEAAECIVVLPGDRVLCFQEGKEQALYFDAHVLDAQRRRHDVRGCRCRFLVRYDHDQSEEIVPLKKLCRRPETDYRLQQLQIANEAAAPSTAVSLERSIPVIDLTNTTSLSPTADVLPQVPTPSPLWSPTPSSASVLSPPAPAYASAPLTVSAQISVPITSVVTETPALAPEQKTVKDDTSVQIQVPMAELNKTEKGCSALVVPEPSMTETTSIPSESIAAKNDIPISVSESNQAESVNSRASDGEAGAQGNYKNPIDANKVVVDTKMTETSDVKTDVLTESSISQSELNCNPIVEADGQEKVESSSLLAPAVNVSTVAGNGESTG